MALQPDERTKLELMVRRPKTDQRKGLCAGIVLDCADGLSNKAVAASRKVTVQTVCKWRARFLQGRLSALSDATRSGQPRKPSDQVA
jgi:transposase